MWTSYSVLNDVCYYSVLTEEFCIICSRALEAVRSVRERLLGRGNSAIEEQRANFAPYGSSSSRRGTNRAISKQWSLKMFCLADKNCIRVPCTPSSREVLIEAGLGPKTFSVPLGSSGTESGTLAPNQGSITYYAIILE